MSADFYLKQLRPLVGSKIVGLVRGGEDAGDGEDFGLEIQKPDGTRHALWILRDDEGNGPGSFSLESMG